MIIHTPIKESDSIKIEILHMCKCYECLDERLNRYKKAIEKELK